MLNHNLRKAAQAFCFVGLLLGAVNVSYADEDEFQIPEAGISKAEAEKLMAILGAQEQIIEQQKSIAAQYYRAYHGLKACIEKAAKEQMPISTCLGNKAM